ncbi:MAG: ABC transporter ATP-binding protein/permease [Spirochaetaceae bacterium]|nr:ABC transporter ATP-binding protein/permease [Spirochaetaceae bacterium]
MSDMRDDTKTMRPPVRRQGPMRGRIVEKPKDFKGTVKKMFRFLASYKGPFICIIVLAVASTIFNIIGPKISSLAITELYKGTVAKIAKTGEINFTRIAQILSFMMSLYVIASVFNGIMGWLMANLSQKVCYDLRKGISQKIGRMPMKYFESKTVGDVLSRITNDVDTFGQSLNQAVVQLITSVVTMLGVLVMMLTINVLMTLVTLIIIPLSIVIVSTIMKHSQKYFKAQQRKLGEVNGEVEETIAGQQVVKLFNYEKKAIENFDKINDELYESAWKSQFFGGMMGPFMNFVGNLGYAVVAISGGIFAFRGIITVGDIQAFIQYVRNFTQPINQLAQVSNMLQSMAAGAERIFEFLEEEEERDAVHPEQFAAQTACPPIGDDNWMPRPGHALGHVVFDNVRFGYDPDKIIINNFNSIVQPGQMIAIVGPTGAGKTTMVKLLMRFYDVLSGSIKLDGHDLREFKRADLRSNFGMVLQDTWLFQGTIMENLRYGRLEATDEEVINAAKAAYADHFIRTLPAGYNTELNEDATNISQGQKQLLTIARAILADRPVLILDEATSSVDTRTEELIQKAMNVLMQNRTSFVIAHRLSTIRDADNILVMRDGDIVEQGNHHDLLAKGGFYADLYNSQFENG